MIDAIKTPAFDWTIELVDACGAVIDSETKANLIPNAALGHLLRAPFGDTSPVGSFYLGLFQGNFIPTPATTAADIPINMVEFVGYSEANRPAWDKSFNAAATYDNFANKAEFTITQEKDIYGAFLVSDMTKAGNSGLLLSVVRFASPKPVSVGQTVRLSGGITYNSASVL